MKNNILVIDSKPLTFYGLLWRIFAENVVMVTGGYILFALLFHNRINNMSVTEHLCTMGLALLLFLIIPIIKIIAINYIDIYYMRIDNETLIIKWKILKKAETKVIDVPLANANLELIPNGKDNPYLKIRIKGENQDVVLKQYNWNKTRMNQVMAQIKEAQANLLKENS